MYQIKIYPCLFVVYLLLMSPAAWCQENTGNVTSMPGKYDQSLTREKIYVHTDKSFYIAGEIAWFKLYDVDASDLMPVTLSKVAYVEITDSTNQRVLQAKIALNNAEGNGSFYLPLSLNSGNYKVRAYTNWMKNFGTESFFEKNITIVNVQKRINIPVTKPAGDFDIQFFPEGGNLVNNIPSKIAFKATDQYGKGISFSGILLDNTDTVLTFKPQHTGMGFFILTPLAHHFYKTVIQTEAGTSLTKELPAVINNGYVMSVSDSADKIRVIIQSDITPPRDVYLIACTGETIKVTARSVLQNGKAVFVFDKAIPGDGISRITIFNDQKQPVCERLYFKKPAKQLDIQLNTDEQVYTIRKKVSINIQPGSMGRKSDSISLSMTVYRQASPRWSDNSSTIDSYLLLTSDLKGFVEDPNYYFLKNDTETNTALDNLMLTNGWRRFRQEDVLQNKNPLFKYAPEYNGLIITGNVINAKTRKPARNIESYISIPGIQSAFSTSLSDQAGQVAFELKKFYGSSAMILQTNTMRDSSYQVYIADPFSDNFTGAPYPVFTLTRADAKTLLEQSISMQVQNIYSVKNLRNFTKTLIDTTAFYLKPDAKYLLDDYTRFTTIEEILREYVTLVDVKKREGAFHYNVYDFANSKMFKTDPLVLLDGVPVFDLNKFMQTDPLKLNKLEVVNRKYFFGNSIFNGVLNWTSYKGDMADYNPGPYATILDYDGLQREREFYSPTYANEEQQLSHLPDFRNVLLWSPYITIAPGASKKIDFYTSDLPGKYVAQVQGISKNGLCGSQAFIFEVKR